MLTIQSPYSGEALVLEVESPYIYCRCTDSCRNVSNAEIGSWLNSHGEVRRVKVGSLNELKESLALYADCRTALRWALYSVDSDLDESLREQATCLLDELLNVPGVRIWLQDLFCVQVLPEDAAKIANLSLSYAKSNGLKHYVSFYEGILDRQSAIRHVSAVWDLVEASSLFGDQHRDLMDRVLGTGLFNRIVGAGVEPELLEMASLVLFEVRPNISANITHNILSAPVINKVSSNYSEILGIENIGEAIEHFDLGNQVYIEDVPAVEPKFSIKLAPGKYPFSFGHALILEEDLVIFDSASKKSTVLPKSLARQVEVRCAAVRVDSSRMMHGITSPESIAKLGSDFRTALDRVYTWGPCHRSLSALPPCRPVLCGGAMKNSNSQSMQLTGDRASAQRLREDIQLHKNDLRWLSENNEHIIIYAVDNDIVKLYSDTKTVAPSNQRRDGYTQIFSGDEKANAISLGVILSHHIFYSLGVGEQGTGTKLLVPPLDKEFASNLSATLNHAAIEDDTAQTQSNVIDVLLTDASLSDIEKAQYLVNQAPKILDVLLGNDSRAAQAKKVCALLNKNRLISLVEISDTQTYGLPLEFVEACSRKKSLADLIFTITLKDDWTDQLILPKHSDERRKNLEDDAEALAALQLINMRLATRGIRLVLITGARNLLETGQKITVKNENQDCSFADLWLRHPRCFLGDPAIFGAAIDMEKKYGGNDLMTLLDAFLAESKQGREHHNNPSDEKDENAQHADSHYPMAIAEFQEAWNRFIANLCLGHTEILEQVSNDYSPTSVAELIREIRDAKSSLKELLKESWQSVFFAAIQTGFLYSLYSWSLAKMRTRNLPKLIFGSFDQATRFVDDIIMQTPGTEVIDFRQRIEAVGKDSSNRYTTYLVFGVLFSAQNNWRIAESLADNAIRLVFGDLQSAPAAARADAARVITGREAYYLKAVAGRHLARAVGELTAAHNAIILAIEMLDLEREVRGNVLPNDTRFDYELCSINVAGAMFEKFLGEAPVFYGRLTTDQLIAKLMGILATRRMDYQGEVCYGSCRDCCRILTSLFIVEITLVCNIGDAFPDRLNRYLTHFRNIFFDAFTDAPDGKGKVYPTQLNEMIYSIVDWWGETDAQAKEQKKTTALDKIKCSEKNIQDGVGVPYESKRHKYLRDFIVGARDASDTAFVRDSTAASIITTKKYTEV